MEHLDLSDDVEDFDEQESLEDEVDLDFLKKSSSEELCNIIIAFRTLGVLKHTAVASMEELSNRRKNGEDYDFENYISIQMNNMPKLEIYSFQNFSPLNFLKNIK